MSYKNPMRYLLALLTLLSACAGQKDAAPKEPTFHRRHIKVLDFGRKLKRITNDMMQRRAYDWFASHVDVAEEQREALKQREPHLRSFRYLLDLTAFPEEDLNIPESFFLHFAEDTRLRFFTLEGEEVLDPEGRPVVVDIEGCPQGTPLRPSCRVRGYLWTSERLLFYPAAPGFPQWMAERLLDGAREHEGAFLDEHGPGLFVLSWGRQTVPVYGGALREYGQRPESPAANARYNADLVAALAVYRDVFQAAGKFLLINPAEYSLEPDCVEQALAAGGLTTELLHRPDTDALGEGEQSFWRYLKLVKELSLLPGGVVDLMGNPLAEYLPPGFTPGGYPSTLARYQMWRLAGYYLLREPPGSPGAVYFNPTFHIDLSAGHEMDFLREWLLANEVDIGDPLGEAFVLQRGAGGCEAGGYAIFAREYSGGLVLLRPQDHRECRDYGEDTGVRVALPGAPLQPLGADGALLPAVSAITLRNAEAVILRKGSSYD